MFIVKGQWTCFYDYSVPVPPNLYSTTLANVGQMRNRGIEFIVNAIPVQTKAFEWNTTLTLSHNSNKLLSLSMTYMKLRTLKK